MEKREKIKPPALGIDTSGQRLGVSFWNKTGKIKNITKPGINQENNLFKLIDRHIKPAGLELRDIRTVCVLKGPGRFTGIRVGLTFASVLSELAGIKTAGISTLEAAAWQAGSSKDFKRQCLCSRKTLRIAVVLRAFRDEYYFQIFRPGPGFIIKPCEAPAWINGGCLKNRLTAYPGALYCAGDIYDNPAFAEKSKDGRLIMAPESLCRLRPASVISACVSRGYDRREKLAPLYLKPARYELL